MQTATEGGGTSVVQKYGALHGALLRNQLAGKTLGSSPAIPRKSGTCSLLDTLAVITLMTARHGATINQNLRPGPSSSEAADDPGN